MITITKANDYRSYKDVAIDAVFFDIKEYNSGDKITVKVSNKYSTYTRYFSFIKLDNKEIKHV